MATKPRVYLETSVVSYFTNWPSRDVIVAGMQLVTRQFWVAGLPEFEPYISSLVLAEIGRGDADAIDDRMRAVRTIPVLTANAAAMALAGEFLADNVIPPVAADDAMHIAIATVNGMDFIVTWNCRHIANAQMERAIVKVIERCGYVAPVVCTPSQLIGGGDA